MLQRLLLNDLKKQKFFYSGRKKKHTLKTQQKKIHKNPLTKEDKLGNQNISRARVANENVIGMINDLRL